MSIFYSHEELDEIGETVVRQYYAKEEFPPFCVDIEGLAKEYLGLSLCYQSFAEGDPDKIGFISDGRTPLTIWKNRKPTPCVFPKGTIVIEKALLAMNESGRKRFTLAHEIAHYLIDNSLKAASFNRVFDSERTYSGQDLKALMNIRETQIDRLAAGILMPGASVRRNILEFTGKPTIPIYGDNVIDYEDRLLIKRMADSMGVSVSAMTIRIRDLRMYEHRDIDEYVKKMVIGQGGET